MGCSAYRRVAKGVSPAVVAITGATGFVGKHLAWHLLEHKGAVRGLVHLAGEEALTGLGAATTRGDVTKPETLAPLVKGADAVVHLVAVIRETPEASFEAVNVQGTLNVAAACRKAGVERLVHVSALGARGGDAYPYADTKWRGEEAVRASGLRYTILRPSILFGKGHPVFATWRRQIRRGLVVPVPGNGRVRFQPLAVSDLAECVRRAIAEPRHEGKTYDLGGPEQLTYDQILDRLMAHLGRKRPRVHVPAAVVVRLAGAMERLSREPDVTRGEIEQLLRGDNVCAPDSVEKHFGFRPQRLEEGLREML